MVTGRHVLQVCIPGWDGPDITCNLVLGPLCFPGKCAGTHIAIISVTHQECGNASTFLGHLLPAATLKQHMILQPTFLARTVGPSLVWAFLCAQP